jgi:hypothetical protein
LALGFVCCNFEASLPCLLAVEMMAFFLQVWLFVEPASRRVHCLLQKDFRVS